MIVLPALSPRSDRWGSGHTGTIAGRCFGFRCRAQGDLRQLLSLAVSPAHSHQQPQPRVLLVRRVRWLRREARITVTTKSRNNVRKRGDSWTYYLYVTEGDGTRRQISKGGFRTRREAEAARVEAVNARNEGTFVRPKRVTVREYLLDEWLPSVRPPTIEESTYRSYERYINLHVVTYIGAIQLQALTAQDLNALYRKLLESGRRNPTPPLRQHDPAVVDLVARLRAKGLTWQQVADAVAVAVPDLPPLHPRQRPSCCRSHHPSHHNNEVMHDNRTRSRRDVTGRTPPFRLEGHRPPRQRRVS